IGAVTLIAAAAANQIVIAAALARGADPLVPAAAATAGAMTFGAIIAGLALQRRFGAFLSLLSVARVAAAAVAAVAIGRLWPEGGFLGGKVGTLLSSAAVGTTFLAVAIATGELRLAELRRARAQR